MSVPVMRTRLKLGDISLPLVEIFDESSVVKRCEMSPSISSEAGEKASTNTMYCPHVVHLTDGGRDDCDYVTTRSNNYKRHEKEMHIIVNVEQCCGLRFRGAYFFYRQILQNIHPCSGSCTRRTSRDIFRTTTVVGRCSNVWSVLSRSRERDCWRGI